MKLIRLDPSTQKMGENKEYAAPRPICRHDYRSITDRLIKIRCFNFGKLIDGKPVQALPPPLNANEATLAKFSVASVV